MQIWGCANANVLKRRDIKIFLVPLEVGRDRQDVLESFLVNVESRSRLLVQLKLKKNEIYEY